MFNKFIFENKYDIIQYLNSYRHIDMSTNMINDNIKIQFRRGTLIDIALVDIYHYNQKYKGPYLIMIDHYYECKMLRDRDIKIKKIKSRIG